MGMIRAKIIEALAKKRESQVVNAFAEMYSAHALKEGGELTLDAATSDIRFPTAEFPDTIMGVGSFGRQGVPWLARQREGTSFRAELRRGENKYLALLWEYSGHTEYGYRIRYRTNDRKFLQEH